MEGVIRLKNERGVTLVELLAAIVIISIVFIFLISIQVIIQNQYKKEMKNTSQLTDITIAMKSITKDLRSAKDITIPNDRYLIIENFSENDVEYILEDNILKRNGSSYVYELKSFYVEEKEEKIVFIKLESESGKILETEVAIRRD